VAARGRGSRLLVVGLFVCHVACFCSPMPHIVGSWKPAKITTVAAVLDPAGTLHASILYSSISPDAFPLLLLLLLLLDAPAGAIDCWDTHGTISAESHTAIPEHCDNNTIRPPCALCTLA
jgi:hypothetical protein